jgi:hypothetical protein
MTVKGHPMNTRRYSMQRVAPRLLAVAILALVVALMLSSFTFAAGIGDQSVIVRTPIISVPQRTPITTYQRTPVVDDHQQLTPVVPIQLTPVPGT